MSKQIKTFTREISLALDPANRKKFIMVKEANMEKILDIIQGEVQIPEKDLVMSKLSKDNKEAQEGIEAALKLLVSYKDSLPENFFSVIAGTSGYDKFAYDLKKVEKLEADRKSNSDGADVLKGNRVPATSANDQAVCNLLDVSGTYVAFNGNGKRRGLGYRIVGVEGKGWLAKCGYQVPGDAHDQLVAVRRFLGELEVVADILGLTIVAFHRPKARWIDFASLIALASQRNSGRRTTATPIRA